MKKFFFWLAVLAVIAIVVVVRITSRQDKAPARGIEQIQAEEGVPVDAVTVVRGDLTQTREISGEVSGWRQTNLSPGADRKVGDVYVREGDRVSRGQSLLRFDVTAAPDQMTRLAQLEESVDNARRQVDRLRPLNEKGAISDSDLDAAETQLAIAEADLRDARLQVDMVSPIDGIVTLVAVAPGDAVLGDQTVAQVAALDSARVTADVSAEVAKALRSGAEARVVVGGTADNPERDSPQSLGSATGRVTRVALGANPSTRLYSVEAVLANPALALRPGEFVTLAVATGTSSGALIVPRAALIGSVDVLPGAKLQVYRVRDGKAELRDVRLGAVTEDRVQVAEGLDEGDVVVVFGANRLKDGDKVRFHELDGVRKDAPAPAPAGTGSASDGEEQS